jgi:hypothetical protein
MQKQLLFFSLFLLLNVSLIGQSKRKYQAQIFLADEVKEGILINVTDSTMTIIPKFSKKAWRKNLKQETVVISADRIQKIQLRRKGNVARGVVVGGLTGVISLGSFGVLADALTTVGSLASPGGNTENGEGIAGKFALVGLASGVLIGTLAGMASDHAKNKRFIINQRPEVFKMLWVQILPYCLVKNQ